MADAMTINPAISSAGQATASVTSNVANAANPLIRDRWVDSASAWSIRKLAGDLGDKMLGHTRLAEQSNYQKLFGIGNGPPEGIRQLSLSGLSWQGYKDAVKQNFKGTHLPNVSVGSYVKDTLIDGNFKDTRDLFNKNIASADKRWGTGLAKAGGIGFMAFDAFKGAKETHDAWAAQEDGSFDSKMKTWTETGKTFVKKAFKNGVAWEAGSLGFAVGTALVPVAGPLGIIAGIGVGALVGAATKTGLDKLMPDRNLPPGDPGPTNDGPPATLASTAVNTAQTVNPFATQQV